MKLPTATISVNQAGLVGLTVSTPDPSNLAAHAARLVATLRRHSGVLRDALPPAVAFELAMGADAVALAARITDGRGRA